MTDALRILFGARRSLLATPDLSALCTTARRFRRVCAITCVTSFGVALVIVLGYRALLFDVVPITLGGLLCLFMLSAVLASRFARLANAESHPIYKARIAHLIEIDAQCAEYARTVRQQDRPLARIDLEEMGEIHLRKR